MSLPVPEANKLESLCTSIGGHLKEEANQLVCFTDNLKIELSRDGKFSIYLKNLVVDPDITPYDLIEHPLLFEKALDYSIAKLEKLSEVEKAYLKDFVRKERGKIKSIGVELDFSLL